MKLRCLITGTGRCGTVFVARLLTHAGLPCGHETIFDWRGLDVAKKRLGGCESINLSHCSTNKWDGDRWRPIPAWLEDVRTIQAESSYMAAPYLDDSALSGVEIVHVTRHPVRVVNSFCNHLEYFQSNQPNNSYEAFIYSHVPELTHVMPQYDRACLYYIRWTQKINGRHFRVEDDPTQILHFLGLNGSIIPDKTINSIKNQNRRSFNVSDVESKEIQQEFMEVGRRFGYHMILNHLMI